MNCNYFYHQFDLIDASRLAFKTTEIRSIGVALLIRSVARSILKTDNLMNSMALKLKSRVPINKLITDALTIYFLLAGKIITNSA